MFLKVNKGWTNSTILDFLSPVVEYEDCQSVCRVRKTTFVCRPTLFPRQERAGCEGWTWTSENNTELINHCLLYSHLGEYRDLPESIRKRSIRNSVLFSRR